jgi:hypothetical protein
MARTLPYIPRNDLHQMSGPKMALFFSPQITEVNSTSTDTRSFYLPTIVMLFFNGPVPHLAFSTWVLIAR